VTPGGATARRDRPPFDARARKKGHNVNQGPQLMRGTISILRDSISLGNAVEGCTVRAQVYEGARLPEASVGRVTTEDDRRFLAGAA